MDPQTRSFKIHPEALPHVKNIADQLEAKFKTRIAYYSEPMPTVVVNGLCKQDTEDCWREIKGYIESNLIISEQIQVDQFQAKYLQTKHGGDIQEMRQNCEVHFSPTNTEQSDISQEQNLTITIKGYVRYVEMASERINNLCSSYQMDMCQLECPTSYFGIWKKRWKELKEMFDRRLGFKHEPTPKEEDFTTPAVKDRFLTQEKVQSKKVQSERVQSEKVQSERVQSEKVQSEKVQSEKVQSEKVQSEKVQSKKVQSEKIQSERVQSEKVQSERVQSEKVQSQRVQSEKVQSEKVQSEKVQSEKVQSEKVQSEKVQSKKVQSEKIQSERVQSERVQSEKVQSERVQSKKVQSEKVQSERVQSEKVQSEKVQSEKAQSEKVQSEKVQSEKVQSEKVQSEKVQSKKIQSERVQSEKVQSEKVQSVQKKFDRMLGFKHEPTPKEEDFTTPAVKERFLTQEKVQSVQEKQIRLSVKEMATLLTGLQKKELDLEGRYCITLDIDRASNLITLTVPTYAKCDLVCAEKDILSFISDKHISIKKVIPCNDLVVGWVFSSRYLRAIEMTATQCEVSLRFQENPQPAIKLQGSKSGIQKVQQKIESVFKQISLTITDDELLVSPSFLPVFYKPDFVHLASKLEEELCVACIYPKPRKVLREIVLRPSFTHTLTFQICSGYLATEEVDAIVNPTSEDLLHHSDLAKAIADTGGPSVQSESTKYVQKHGKLSPGDAVCLRSGDLPCNHIIHTVKPQLKEAKEDLLHATYFTVLNSLECARRHAICSIALPAIGIDVIGVPSHEHAKTTMNAVGDFCQKHPKAGIKTVRFVLFNNPTINLFTKVFDSGIFTEQSLPAPIASHTCSASPHVYWFWQNDQGHFSRFPQEVEKVLTVEYNKSPKGHHCLQINGQNYEINFQTMTQKNMRTGFTREIQKQKPAPASAPSTTSSREVEEKLPNLKQLVVNIRGPRDSLPEAKSRIKAKLKNSEITSHDILLPLMITSVQERQLKAIASNHNVGCDIQQTTAKAAAKHAEPGSQSRMVLRLKGHTKSLQRAACEIYSQIKEFEVAHDKAQGQYPPEWEKQTETIEVFTIQPGTPEWNQVEKLFKSTMINAKITRIKRIQNKWLWEKYVQHKTRMDRKNDGRVHERKLFHGTSDTQPEKIYQSEEGFDMRFSRIGKWGQANYFAVDAYYSDLYAYKRSDGQREILLAKVLTGISYYSEPDSSLRLPPLKYSGSEAQIGQVRYDTITGYIRGSRVTVQVYMTYSNEKAYPAYLIRYYYYP